MENKINELLEVMKDYYGEEKGFQLKIIQGEPALIIDDCEWYGETFEECLTEAIQSVKDWYADKNLEEWQTEDEIAKKWEQIAC